jgi:hypothetical protein
VNEGRLVVDVPTDRSDGTEVEVAVVDHADAELLEEFEASERDEAAGDLLDFDAVVARLGSSRKKWPPGLASPEGRRVSEAAGPVRGPSGGIVEGRRR